MAILWFLFLEVVAIALVNWSIYYFALLDDSLHGVDGRCSSIADFSFSLLGDGVLLIPRNE